MKKICNDGFTLIELSIVLVIIGLIVGGVLAGRELIYTATLNKQISQIEQFNTATNTFRSKYNCLPGDCTNASNLGFTAGIGGSYGTNGNGDGLVCSGPANYPCQTAYGIAAQQQSENTNFWHHQWQAGLLPPTQCAKNPSISTARCITTNYDYNAGLWTPKALIQCANNTSDNQCGIMLLSSPMWNNMGSPTIALPFTHFYYIAIVPSDFGIPARGADVWAIDRKIDDGMPTTGRILAYYTHADGIYSPGANYCINEAVTPNLYQEIGASNDPFNCTMIWAASF